MTKASDEAILQNICFWGYDFLENRICSYKTLRRPSWKILSVLLVFLSPDGNFFLLKNLYMWKIFWFFWNIWCVLIKELCLLLENSFLLHPSLLENLMCSRNLFKKGHSWKKRTDISAKKALRYLWIFLYIFRIKFWAGIMRIFIQSTVKFKQKAWWLVYLLEYFL